MKNENIENNARMLGRMLARELTLDELEVTSGGVAAKNCSKSTCSASDNKSCDLDVCADNWDD